MISEIAPTIAMLQNHSLATAVQQELERAILAGELAPGTKLVESTLADKLGVSRGPVREAFRMLEEAGLVRNEKNRGVHVRDLPLDEAIEIFELRAAMEELAGRKLAEQMDAEQHKELSWMVDSMEKAAHSGDAAVYHLINLQFHERLVEMAGNRKLTTLYRKLTAELSLFRRINLNLGGLMSASLLEHREILYAIASGDADTAGQAMYQHVMESRNRTVANESMRQVGAINRRARKTVSRAAAKATVQAPTKQPPKQLSKNTPKQSHKHMPKAVSKVSASKTEPKDNPKGAKTRG